MHVNHVHTRIRTPHICPVVCPCTYVHAYVHTDSNLIARRAPRDNRSMTHGPLTLTRMPMPLPAPHWRCKVRWRSTWHSQCLCNAAGRARDVTRQRHARPAVEVYSVDTERRRNVQNVQQRHPQSHQHLQRVRAAYVCTYARSVWCYHSPAHSRWCGTCAQCHAAASCRENRRTPPHHVSLATMPHEGMIHVDPACACCCFWLGMRARRLCATSLL